MASNATHSVNSKPYSFGHDKSATGSHASRTIQDTAGFALHLLKPNMKVVDIGCGPGTITAGFCDLCPDGQVIGIDLSPQVLEEARKLAEALPNGYPKNLDFRQVDMLKQPLPFEDGSIDLVFGSEILVHLGDPARVAREVKRILKPGTGVFATANGDVGTHIWHPDPTGYLAMHNDWLRRLVTEISGNPCPWGSRDSPQWLINGGFDIAKMEIGASSLVFSTLEKRRWWMKLMTERNRTGQIGKNLSLLGITQEDLQKQNKALEKWAETDGAVFHRSKFEIIAYV